MLELPLRCDTLFVDVDFQRAVLVWRSLLPLDDADDDIDRIVVALERHAEPRKLEQLLRWLPRGTVSFAIEEDGEVEGDPDDLEMASYEALEHAAEPELSLANYAAICAHLAEGKQNREDVLAAHDQDERSWTIEERAWTDKMGDGADHGDGTLTMEFAELFVVAQSELKGPDEPRSLESYSRIKKQYVRSHNPARVLEEHAIGMGEWMRLDRHWQERAAADRAVAQQLSSLLDSGN